MWVLIWEGGRNLHNIGKSSSEPGRLNPPPPYQIYMDLRKAYNNLERGKMVEIIWGYGVLTQFIILLKECWEGHKWAEREEGFHGDIFVADRGATQGYPLTPNIFIVVADFVAHHWLNWVCGRKNHSRVWMKILSRRP